MGFRKSKVAIATIGCKTNQCDSAWISSSLSGQGYEIVPSNASADYVIINTCSVTARASAQSRKFVRQARRTSPEALIVVTGCHAQAFPEEMASLPETNIILGNREKECIADFMPQNKTGMKTVRVSPLNHSSSPLLPATTGTPFVSRTRPFLKIQDGCEESCSYCIVPRVRGSCRSVPVEEVIKGIADLRTMGYREAVLTGINLGCYGRDLSPPANLSFLLERIERDQLIPRIRISSVEPKEWTEALIRRFRASSILCPHLHIPIQSGDDEVLRRMNRPYGREDVRSLLFTLLDSIPDLAIGLDIIVGFPGEGDEQFRNTVRLIQEIPITYLHVFPFSRRSGTPAASFPQQVPARTIQERSRILREIGGKKRLGFVQRFIGKSLPVLVEGNHKRNGYRRGLTRNYIQVAIQRKERSIGEEIPCTISSIKGETVYAVPDPVA